MPVLLWLPHRTLDSPSLPWAHVVFLEGLSTEFKVVLLAGSPLQDEATLGHCGVEALTILEVAGCVLGGDWGYGGPKLVHSLTLRLIYLPSQCLTFFNLTYKHLKVS